MTPSEPERDTPQFARRTPPPLINSTTALEIEEGRLHGATDDGVGLQAGMRRHGLLGRGKRVAVGRRGRYCHCYTGPRLGHRLLCRGNQAARVPRQ